MKTDEIMRKVMAGQGDLILVCEYRGTQKETIGWSDKGTAKKSDVMKHALEAGARQIQLSEWPPRGSNGFPVDYVVPFKKGQRVVACITSWTEKQGVTRAGGTLTALEV